MKKLIQFFSFCLAFILSLPVFGQQIAPFEGHVPANVHDWNLQPHASLPGEAPSNRGEVHPELATQLQQTLDSMAQMMDMVGVGAAFRTPEGDIWAGGSGISQDAPIVDSINENHRLAIGSISKTLTSACILQLYDEGLLHLDDTISQYLPPFTNVNSTATIRQLLNHTSGTYNYTNHPQLFNTLLADPDALIQVWSVPEVIDSFVLAPDFPPGADWNYSNTGYILLGEIIKSVTGNEYYDEIRMRFLEPLGLNTVFHAPYDAWQQPTAHLWADFNGDGLLEDQNDIFQNWYSLYSAAGAAGAYFATPSDMVEWMWHLQAGDLLTPATQAEMRDAIVLGPTFSYGLGTMRIPFFGKAGWGHGGDIFYAASTYYIPNDDVSISVQSNHSSYTSNDMIPIIAALLTTYSNFNPPVATTEIFDDLKVELAPNPFHDELRIEYDLPNTAEVNVSIFNMLGETVKDFGTNKQIGQQVITWYGEAKESFEAPSGSYFVKIEVDGEVILKKLIKN